MAADVASGGLVQDLHSVLDALAGETPASQQALLELNKITESMAALLPQERKEAQASLKSALRREYTRLFTDPREPEVAIYETLFCTPAQPRDDFGPTLVRSAAAADALAQYRAAGLELKERDSADHMRIECEFCGYLYRCLATEASAERRETLWAQRVTFVDTHIRPWFSDFFAACLARARHPFYRLAFEMGLRAAAALREEA
jgi:TorA maturation chaperone TorD